MTLAQIRPATPDSRGDSLDEAPTPSSWDQRLPRRQPPRWSITSARTMGELAELAGVAEGA
ncbi:hypothetical protein ACPA9J_26445 [Pseudomonas aeruginosa]